jgi:hypothetical protein
LASEALMGRRGPGPNNADQVISQEVVTARQSGLEYAAVVVNEREVPVARPA